MKSSTKLRLLLADNSSDYRQSLRAFLELENYKVEEAGSVEEAKRKLQTVPLDVALVDLRLTNDSEHDISGLEVAKSALEKEVPCLIITGFPSVETTRLALRSRGVEPLAVDYIPKESGPQAILDAIKVISHQVEKLVDRRMPSGLRIDLERKLVWYKEEPVNLSRYQYAFLAHLHRKGGAVCSPEELMKVIYGEDMSAEDASLDRRLERLAGRLREKIEDDPSEPRHLIKVYGRGFRLVIDH